jgi:hypothetical protein
MKSALRAGIFSLIASSSAFAQVQVFEQDLAGIHPFAGFRWNAEIMEYGVGFEYNIEGRTSLGMAYYRPVSDSITFNPELKAYVINPYGEFEFIEPGNLTTFSFAVRFDFIHEDVTRPSDELDSFRRTSLGGGPIFSWRFYANPQLSIVPRVGYEMFYTRWKKDDLTENLGEFDSDYEIWHDVIGSFLMVYKLDEFNALTFDPKAVLKLGTGRPTTDFVNVHLNFGWAHSF